MISSLTLLITYVLLGLPLGMVGIPLTLVTGDISWLYKRAMWLVRFGVRLAGIRIQVSGLENVPANTACIFMSNHVSNLDPPILLPLVPGRTSVFLKRSLMKIPVLGYAMRLGDYVPVDRAGNVKDAQESIRLAGKVLGKGVHVTSFVEGTRSRDGRLLSFKKGPFYLAMETHAPCIPVSIWGTEAMMQKGSLKITPGTAHVVFHPPLYPRDFATRDALMEAARKSIASVLPAWMTQQQLK
jgi:1-acyl-sn-glycerol-3-phosphate acyltransferase